MFAECVNVTRPIASVIAAGKATLTELDSVLSVEDVYTILEIMAVHAHNRKLAIDAARKEQ